MAINNCTPPRIFGPPAQTIFLGCSVKDFNLTAGWNEQASNLTVNLVQDDCASNKIWWDENLVRQSGMLADPGFVEPEPGMPVYFRMEEDPRADNAGNRKGIEYAGLVQSWTKSYNAQGNPIYTVQITDPRIVLQNTQVVVGNYAGASSAVPNLINAYAFAESQTYGSVACASSPPGRFGGVTLNNSPGYSANARGMVWNDIKCAISTLTSCPNPAIAQGFYGSYLQGARIKYVGSNTTGYGAIGDAGYNGYMVDLSDVPFAPTDYRISGPTISVMELITQVCQDAGCDFYVEYQPTKNGSDLYHIIKIRTVQRGTQPAMGRLQEFIDQQSGLAANAQGGIISWTEGEEVRNEDTSIYLIGGEERNPLEISNVGMLPYWGLDNDGALIQAQVAGGEYQVRLDVRRLNTALYTSFSTSFIWVSESELRAALGDMDAWKHVSLIKGLGVASHFASIKQAKFLSAEKIQQAADGDLPEHALVVPNIEATSDEMNPSSNSAKDLTKIYDFIKSFADEFYGKQFIAATDFVCYVADGDAGKLKYSHEPSTEGCWVDASSVVGLANPSSAGDFFTSDDGRYQAIVRYPYSAGFTYAGGGGSLVSDPSNLGDDNYISNGVYIWQKADLDARIIFGNPQAPSNGVPGMILKVGAPVFNQTSEDTGGSDGVDQSQAGADFLAREGGGAGLGTPGWTDRSAFSLSMVGNAISPDAALVPIWSHVTVYGPWGVAGLPGQTRVENDESFVPWEFGSSTLMNAAALDKVSNATSQMRKGERGTVQVAGFLGIPLGSELLASPSNNDYVETRTANFSQCANAVAYTYLSKPGWTGSNGPNITNINVGVGAQGFTTEYQFSTYTPRFGRFDKDNADRLRQIGQQRLSQARNARSKQALAQQITAAVANIRQRINDQIGKTARAPKSASHMFIGGFAGSSLRNKSFTMNAKEAALTFPSDAAYAESAMMSMDGLIRPVSKAGDGSLPRFISHTDSTCSGNVGISIAPDGPKLTYSGIKINQKYLDPLSNPGVNVSERDSIGSGHDVEVLARNTSAPPSGWAIREGEEAGDGGYADDYRFFALRGPLMLQGWGYDTAGKPIPNAADSDASAEAGTFTTTSLEDNFLDGFLKKPKTWPVAPVDLRLDRKRGVWTVPPPPRNLHVNATGYCLSSEDTVGTVTNPQSTYDSGGTAVEDKITIAQSPWDIQIPKDVGKIPVYYDTYDCKYYPFPVNRLDITVSGVGGEGTAGYVDRFVDVKHIVFASGFSGLSLTSGCDNTLYIRATAEPSGGSGSQFKAKQATWSTCLESACAAELPTQITSCSGTDCLVIGSGLTYSENADGELQLDSWRFIQNIDYTCDGGGGFTATDGLCNPFMQLKIGSGLRVEQNSDSCNYTIHSYVPVAGYTLAECVTPAQGNQEISKNLAEYGINFTGYLSTTLDSDNCRILVSGVKPSITVANNPHCGDTVTEEGLVGTIVAGSGLEFVRDGCSGTLNSVFKVEGYEDECGSTLTAYPYITGIKFDSGIAVTDLGCGRVQVYSRFGVSGNADCRGDYYDDANVTGIVFGRGLRVVAADTPTTCQPNVSLDLHASGAENSASYIQKYSNWDAIQFTGNLFVSQVDACTIRVSGSNSDIVFSGVENCGAGAISEFTKSKIAVSTGLILRQRGDYGVIMSNILAAGSAFDDPCDFYTRTTDFSQERFSNIEFIGNLSGGYNSETCTVTVSGGRGFTYADGFSSQCDQSPSNSVSNLAFNNIEFGTGLSLTDQGNCTARVQSLFYVKSTGNCRSTAFESSGGITGIRLGNGLKAQGGTCVAPLISANLYASGAENPSASLAKIGDWNSIVFTGNLFVSSIDGCTIQVSGSGGGGGTSITVTGSSSACTASDDVSVSDVTNLVFSTGLKTITTDGGVSVSAPFFVSGLQECNTLSYSDRITTGLVFGKGIQVEQRNDSCQTLVTAAIYASGGNATAALDPQQRFFGIQFTGDLAVTALDDCYIQVSGVSGGGSIAVTGSSDQCTAAGDVTNNSIDGIIFGTGLKVSDDNGAIHVNAPYYIVGDKTCGSPAYQRSLSKELVFSKGLKVTDSGSCGQKIESNIHVSGDGASGTFDLLKFVGNLTTTIVDSCTIQVSGEAGSVSVTGSSNPCTLGNDVTASNVQGIVFSTGLKTITTAGGVSVSAPFSVSGSSACRGTSFSQSTTTGIVVGKGLKASTDASCATLIDFNVAASGGPGSTKLQGWDGIQFTGNLTVESVDGCTIRVSGSQSSIAVTGSTNPCTPGNDTVVNEVAGILFGTGLKTTSDGSAVHVNSRFYVGGTGDCGATDVEAAISTGILVSKGLKVTNSSCVSTIELNFLAQQSGTCGGGAGASSAISSMIYGTGLTFSANGCTGILQSNITADGSTYSNPCSVGGRSNAFSNKRFENIEFAGYLNSAINGCDLIVSGGKSPINMGSDGSLFEAIALVAGDNITITQSGTCTGVISASSQISVTGSSTECAANNDVVNNDIDGFIFGIGLKTTDNGGAITVESPSYVGGIETCRSTQVASSQTNALLFGRGLQVTGSGSCGKTVESIIAASGEGGFFQTFDQLRFVGNGLSVSAIDSCTIQVSGLDPGAVTISGSNTCGVDTSSDGITASTIILGTGLAFADDGNGNAVISTTLKAQGGAITDACANPPTRGASFSEAINNLIFTGYLSASQDDSCNITIEGVQTPITIAKSGTFCGEASNASGSVTSINLASGLDLTVNGCSATISSNIKVAGGAACGRSAVDPAVFQTLEFGSGLSVNQKAGSDCTWQVNSAFSVEGRENCGYVATITANGVENLVFGEGLTMTDDGNCQVTVSAGKYIGGGGSNGCRGGSAAPTEFNTLLVSGLGLSTDGCTGIISGPTLTIAHDGACNSNTLSATCFESLTFSTGIKVYGSAGSFKVAAGFEAYGIDCGTSNINTGLGNFNNFAYLVAGKGINITDAGDCTIKLDVGLSGIRSGSNVRGQQVNCGPPSVERPGACSTDCLSAGYEGPFADRSLPESVGGLYSGPGIGFASCEDDCNLIIFQNSSVSGLNNTCQGELGLQVFSTYFSNAFTINGTNGIDLTTNTPVDGASFSHGANIFLNEGGSSWSCPVVTGIVVTKNGSYVTDVQALTSSIGGTSTCTPGDATSIGLPGETRKYWVTQIPC